MNVSERKKWLGGHCKSDDAPKQPLMTTGVAQVVYVCETRRWQRGKSLLLYLVMCISSSFAGVLSGAVFLRPGVESTSPVMDKGQSETSPSPADVNMEDQSHKELKPRGTSNNILTYLISRQLGRPRNDVDLSKWVWMLPWIAPGWSGLC
jgi:hypothetical protein